MTYRVTELENGVQQGHEDFSTKEEVLRDIEVSASREYRETVAGWLAGGAHEPLVINQSSVWSDVWEYIP